jgi:hypothetical protein
MATLILVLVLSVFISSIFFAARKEYGLASYLVLTAIFFNMFLPKLLDLP